jgi:alanine dehydrogenase
LTLYLREEEVKELFSAKEAVASMEECFSKSGLGETAEKPRLQIDTNDGWLRVQAAAMLDENRMGFKAYSLTRNFGPRYLAYLYDSSSGELLSIMDADHLTMLRTAATCAVATKHLANEDASSIGLLGSGRLAKASLETILLVRPIKTLKVFSPTKEHREQFAKDAKNEYGLEATAVDEPKEAVKDCDIAVTATGNMTRAPLVFGGSFAVGTHINAIGAVGKGRAEIDSTAFKMAETVVVDSVEECVANSQELIDAMNLGVVAKSDLVELAWLVSSQATGRTSREEITLFKSQGSGLQDVVAASWVNNLAVKSHLGTEVGKIGSATRS